MKKFYNNTKMSGAFSNALRVLALLCVLLGFSSSAWGTTYYLWYNAKSNETNYNGGNFTMSAGATLTNNKCVWTISNLRKDNSYFYISTSSTYSESNLLGVEIVAHNPQDGTVNGAGKQPYGKDKVGFYVSCQKAGSTVTITIDFSTATKYEVFPVGGGAAACTPSATITSASYDGTQITLSGSLTETCKENTYYGFRYRIKGATTWGENDYIEGTYPDKQSHHSTTSIDNFTVSWDEFEAGKTYEFCAYAYQNGFYNSSTKISVTTPVAPTEVLLTKDAVYNEDTKTANLYGYLKQNPVQNNDQPCANLVEYGFVLKEGMGSTPKVGDAQSIIRDVGSTTDNLIRGEEFEGSISVGDQGIVIKENKVYAYRAYVNYNGTYIYSNEIRYFSTGACIPQPGGNGTIYITVDGSRSAANDDDCGLVYSDLQVALEKLKANPIYTDTETGNLLQAVVINVSQFDNTAGETGKGNYEGGKYLDNDGNIKEGKKYAVCGGDGGTTRDLTVLAITHFNEKMEAETYDPEHTLTIQANNGDKPRVVHILIRNSRNVILKGLNILSNNDGTTKDTALEMDAGFAGGYWNEVSIDNGIHEANIIVKDCSIGSNGFTGVHINSYSGLTFENNTFNLSIDDVSPNAYGWGASVKFFECDNIKFIRNNFWGGHATLLWLQQTTNALFYNNVFWNTNQYDQNGCVAVRACAQYNERSSNIAVLYNTFYVAEDNLTNAKKYDFLKFGINTDAPGYKAEEDKNYTGNFYFKYNNCYSYDNEMNGKTTSPCSKYTESKETLCPNNFWSVYDQTQYNKKTEAGKTTYRSVFDIDVCTKVYINVGDLICKTTASGPAELVIRDLGGEGLRVGNKISTQDIHSMSSILLTDEELLSDRYRSDVRKGEKWTMGALEATATNYVETIYWIGGKNGNWDDRGNWAYILDEGSAATTRAANQRTLTCVDILSPNLKIVIPQKGSAKYPTATTSTYYYPEIPASFDATNREKSGIPAGEQVSAGVGTGNPIEKYATSIELEYGAALKGVHRLWDQSANKFRYDEGITSMTLERDQWTLVGPVVFPWKDDTKTETRDVISGDYFLDYIPNVYMHEAVIGGTTEQPSLTWNKSFASLSVPVPANSAFAVSIPNSYGNLWGIGFPADVYYTQIAPDESMINDATVPKSFKPFEGRFVNENALITYSDLTPNQPILLNNSYTCNIDVKKLEGENYANGKVYLYDYLAKSIKLSDDASWEYEGYNGQIKPQNGFVFIPNVELLTVTEDMLVGGDTKSRSAKIENNKVAINLHAGSSNSLVHSSISIEHDPELGTNVESAINAPKVFAYREAPELYMMAHDKTLCRLAVPKSETVIPLGIQVKTPMYVTFKVARNSGYSKVTLVDTENDYEHDLLESPYTADILPKGTCEGRYFLNVVSDASDFGDDDVTTSVEDASGEDLAINIYNDTDNSDAITVVTSNVELEKIYVSDSMGRVIPFEAKGNYAKIKIPNAMGVYIVQVIGDKASRTEKVILK